MGLLRWLRSEILLNKAYALKSILEHSKKQKTKMPIQKTGLDGTEKSMISLIKNDGYLLMGDSRKSNVKALEEFSAGTGISDVTLFSIDKQILNKRTRLDKEPITSRAYIEIMLYITSVGRVDIALLKDEFYGRYSFTTLKKHLHTLLEKGVVTLNEGYYHSTFNFNDISAQKVVAIEAKVRDWKSGIKQAMRYQEYADYSYLAIYESHIDSCLANKELFEKLGLGLIGVSDGGITIHVRAQKSQYQQIESKILAFERFISIFDGRYKAFEVGNNLSR
jgi:hypothetical protein